MTDGTKDALKGVAMLLGSIVLIIILIAVFEARAVVS